MAQAGAQMIGDTSAIGSIGILEALPYLLTAFRLQEQARRYLQQHPVDLAILIDYMNPNLKLGQFLRSHLSHLPTAYYIAPQQWVWSFSRKDTETLVRISDRMVAVFPQEADYYRRFGAQVSYFGHPLVDIVQQAPTRDAARTSLGLSERDRIVTLLPASRNQEVSYILPLLLIVARQLHTILPDIQFLMPLSLGKFRTRIEGQVQQARLPIRLVEGGSWNAIAAADLVLNKSGTANLEVALLNVPQVVVYRLNPITARIGYYLLKVNIKHVSPVNLFLDRTIVPEFVQWEATPEALTKASLALLTQPPIRQQMLTDYAELREKMGAPGVCDRVANYLLDFVLAQSPLVNTPP
jgi:lipid-A-disaccharide synthase